MRLREPGLIVLGHVSGLTYDPEGFQSQSGCKYPSPPVEAGGAAHPGDLERGWFKDPTPRPAPHLLGAPWGWAAGEEPQGRGGVGNKGRGRGHRWGGQVGRARAPSPSVTFYGKARAGRGGRREARAGARGGGAEPAEAGAWGARQVSGYGVGVLAVSPRQGQPQVATWATLGHRTGPSLALLGGSGWVLSLVPVCPRISAIGDSRRLSAGTARGSCPCSRVGRVEQGRGFRTKRTASRIWIEL